MKTIVFFILLIFPASLFSQSLLDLENSMTPEQKFRLKGGAENPSDLDALVEQAKKAVLDLRIAEAVDKKRATLESTTSFPPEKIKKILEEYELSLRNSRDFLDHNDDLSHSTYVDPMTDEKTPIVYLKGNFEQGTPLKEIQFVWIGAKTGQFMKFFQSEISVFSDFDHHFSIRFDKKKQKDYTAEFTDKKSIQISKPIDVNEIYEESRNSEKMLIKVGFISGSEKAIYAFNLKGFEKEIELAKIEASQ